MGFAVFMINEGINNHPFKKFGNEDQKVAGILVEARGTEQGVHGTYVFFLRGYIMYGQR
jgi:hypothetical protein